MDDLTRSGEPACAFCEYLAGARPYTVLTRDDETAVLVTREQRGVAHLLVIPVLHVPTILELPDRLSAPLLRRVRDAATWIVTAYQPAGVAVWQNNGTAAGQAVDHLHFHVAGTLPGGGTNFGDVDEVDLAVTEAIARRLQAGGLI